MQKPETLYGLPWLLSKPERAILDELQFACVYAAGPSGGRPLRLGHSSGLKLKDTVRHLQKGCWKELQIHQIVWTKGEHIASRVDNDASVLLDQRRMIGSWFDVTPEFAGQAIRIAAEKARINPMSHDEMLDHVRAIRAKRLDNGIVVRRQ